MRRPWTFPASVRARFRHHPTHAGGVDGVGDCSLRAGHGDEGVAGSDVVGKAAAAEGYVEADALAAATLELGAPGGRVEIGPRRRDASGRRRVDHLGRRRVDRLVHGLPARAPAQVGGEPTVDVGATGAALGEQRRRPHHDARSAEPALRSARADERAGECVPRCRVEPFDGGHDTAVHPDRRRHAGDARVTVDEHRATAALALRRTPVLGRHETEPLAQHGQQRLAGSDADLHRRAVAHEADPIGHHLLPNGRIGVWLPCP